MIQGSSELSVLYGPVEEGAWFCYGLCAGSAVEVDGFGGEGEGFWGPGYVFLYGVSFVVGWLVGWSSVCQAFFSDERWRGWCVDDIKIIYNDWPYGIDKSIVHLCVWTKFPLDVDEKDPVRRFLICLSPFLHWIWAMRCISMAERTFLFARSIFYPPLFCLKFGQCWFRDRHRMAIWRRRCGRRLINMWTRPLGRKSRLRMWAFSFLNPTKRHFFIWYFQLRESISLTSRKIIWFKNWAKLKSIHSMEHFHIMMKDPDVDFIKEITKGDRPASEQLSEDAILE